MTSKNGGKLFDEIYEEIKDHAIDLGKQVPSKERVKKLLKELEDDGMVVKKNE